MDKLRVLKHYFLQEVTATLLNSVGDSLFTMSDHLAQILAGFSDPRHIIVQDLDVTPDTGLAVKAGLQGCFIYRQTTQDAILGVYKGTRPDQISPYVEESLAIATADPTNPRIDILEAEIVQEDDPDYYDTVFIFNNMTETSGPEQKYTKRVRNVKLYIKTGTPAAIPVAPAATAGRFTLREITVPALAVTISPGDIVAQTPPPIPSPWTFNHPVTLYPSLVFIRDNTVYITGDQTVDGVKTYTSSPVVPDLPIDENSQNAVNAAFVMMHDAYSGVGWDMTTSGGTPENPAEMLYAKDDWRLKMSITWNVEGNPSVIVHEFSDDAGANYTVIGTETVTYDVDQFVTAVTWT